MRSLQIWVVPVVIIACLAFGFIPLLSSCNGLDNQPDTGDSNVRFVKEYQHHGLNVYRDTQTGYAYLIVYGSHGVAIERLEGDYMIDKGDVE